MSALGLRRLTGAALLVLVLLCLSWELWLAPLRPGGSWLALKALPLLIPLRGILSGSLYTHRWLTMLILVYAAEGIVRGYGERGAARLLAFTELALALVIFVAAIGYVRHVQRTLRPTAGNGACKSR